MFEQATLDTRGALRSPWAVGVSVVGQSLVIGAVFLLSVIHTDALPRALLSIGLAVPGVPPGPAPRQSHPSAARPTRPSPQPFTAPSTIPTRIAQIHETALASPAFEADMGPGVAGGIGVGQGFPGIVIDAPPLPPPSRVEPPAQTKPAPQTPAKPIAVSSGVQAAKLIRQIKPAYSALAITARIQGTVRLVAIIGRDGAIKNLQVASGHPLLTPAAVEAVKQWLYQPTLLNGEPVEVITQIDVNFTLSR